MSLSSICIDRPVFTVVLNALVVLVGIVALQDLPVRQLPRVESPVISVTTTYPGAAPSLIEQQITTPLEEQLGGIDGIRFMTSTSTTGTSKITMTFGLETDPTPPQTTSARGSAKQWACCQTTPRHRSSPNPIRMRHLSSISHLPATGWIPLPLPIT